jgi:hypothetical protein
MIEYPSIHCHIITIAEASKLRLGFFLENKHASMIEYLSTLCDIISIYLSIYRKTTTNIQCTFSKGDLS